MNIDILGKIMGTPARVKLMRLFLFHPKTDFTREELINRTKTPLQVFKTELTLLEKVNFITKREITKTIVKTTKHKTSAQKKQVIVYRINDNFPLTEPFSALLLESELVHIPELSSRLKPIGKLKLLVLSGIFLKESDRPLDLLIVGDKLDISAATKIIGVLESEMGRELRYALFTTEDFLYRIKMYDKLVRDLLEFPHQKIINQLGEFI